MAIVAHPDDEILGPGGALAKHAGLGHDVSVVILGENVSSRCRVYREPTEQELAPSMAETAEAMAVLGVSEFRRFPFPDNRFDTVALLDVVKVVEGELERFQPRIVYTHHCDDLNVDHRIVADAVRAATRPLPDTPVEWVIAFHTLSSTEWRFSPGNAFCPNLFVDISSQLSTKLRAMSAYSSELREFPHPRSLDAMTHQARMWGATSGLAAAEAFIVVRGMWRGGDFVGGGRGAP